MKTLRVERLVDEQLHHHQLIDRQTRDSLHKHLRTLVQILSVRRLDRQAPLERLAARQRVTREQQPLCALRADAVRP
jgi:hypothetical protein